MYQVLTVRDEVTKDLPPGLVRAPHPFSITGNVQTKELCLFLCQELWRGPWNSSRGWATTFSFSTGIESQGS